MNIRKEKKQGSLYVALDGRLDTTTAPMLDAELKQELGAAEEEEKLSDVKDLTFDFANLEYVSSAGLRVLLSTQKVMNRRKGSMVIRNTPEEVEEVFELTGFIDIFTLE